MFSKFKLLSSLLERKNKKHSNRIHGGCFAIRIFKHYPNFILNTCSPN